MFVLVLAGVDKKKKINTKIVGIQPAKN